MKSALEIVAYSTVSETEGTIALLEVAIAALNRSGFTECADLADHALNQFVDEALHKMAAGAASAVTTWH